MFDTKTTAVVRDRFLALLTQFLTENDFEVLVTSGTTLDIQTTEGDQDGAVQFSVKVPKGPRDGSGYDPVAVAEMYAEEQAVKAEKKVEADRKKAEKIARDKAKREAKAKVEG